MKTGTILKPLFDFDSIVDLGLSICHYIKDNGFVEKYFNTDITIDDDYFLRCLLLSSNNYNPFYVLLNEDYIDHAESLFNEIIEDKDLVEYYTNYDISSLVTIFNNTAFTKPEILCHNNFQVEYCKKLYDGIIKINLLKKDTKFEINKKYDSYFTSNIWNIGDKLDNPMGIQFKITRAKWNLENKGGFELPLIKAIGLYSDTCKFSLVDPYTDIILPKEEEK